MQKCFIRHGLDKINLFYIEAVVAAYTQCDEWLLECHRYLKANRDWVENFCHKDFFGLHVTPLEATYLMWFNYDTLGIDEATLLAATQQKVLLSPGSIFGEINCYFRLNIACPYSALVSAMMNIKTALINFQARHAAP